MTILHISAITIAVSNMSNSIEFYGKLGFNLTYGDKNSFFSTLRLNQCVINLILATGSRQDWWGRIILRVEDVDKLHKSLTSAGLTPEEPRNAAWGERFFHIWDPDGHEISLAHKLHQGP
jgi:catechol 2,3-dioxygenase-like lactoylglutathione lyase family enzyme